MILTEKIIKTEIMRQASNYGATSFHGQTICTTPNKLIALSKKLDAPYGDYNGGRDKVNFDFEFETENGIYFTVYDWKEYRTLGLNDLVDFHIGARNGLEANEGLQELIKALEDE